MAELLGSRSSVSGLPLSPPAASLPLQRDTEATMARPRWPAAAAAAVDPVPAVNTIDQEAGSSAGAACYTAHRLS